MHDELYNLNQTFDVLQRYKITTHKESVRRWLRDGTLKGIKPTSKKKGWRIRKKDLDLFIQDRLPIDFLESKTSKSNTTLVVKDFNTTHDLSKEAIIKQAREDMWWELVRNHIFQDYIKIKKTDIKDCLEHRREYRKDLYEQIWNVLMTHRQGYAKPTVYYLLNAFLFDGNRIEFDPDFASLHEQILYPLIIYIKKRLPAPKSAYELSQQKKH